MAKTKNGPKISEAEWEVMNVLWDRAPLTAQDVCATVCDPKGWSPNTVKTLLARLVRKGALRYREDGNRYLYLPAVARETLVREQSRSFVARVFGERPSTPLLLHMVESAELSEGEIDELRQILERKSEVKR